MKLKKKVPKTFISFLLASILIWLLITLSKEYTISVNFPISYVEIAQNKLLQGIPEKELEIVLKANGFKILKTRLFTKEIEISGSRLLKKSGTTHFLLVKPQKQQIQKQLPSGLVLQDIIRDTLFLNVESLVTKKLALKPNLKIKYHVGYDLSEKIKVVPDSILVSGPGNYIASVTSIDLLQISLEDVKMDFIKKASIKVPEGINNLKFDVKEITISGKIEKFTEGTFEVQYKIINIPDGLRINTLSKKIQVTFIVGLSNFNNLSENSFQIVCDYSVSKESNLGYLIPKLVHKPSEIKSYKIIPNKIDFLIQN
ncbi:hypothetical protein OAA58_01360 [Polaribacter sp.]|nr:hypothetical protein [Polaribacter sp.]